MDYLIVVVDDEALCLTNVRNLLHEENMKAVCLRSGKDLIKYVQKNTPDLILLDIFMPEMDGFTTYKALREYESQHGKNHVPVIFLSGDSDIGTEKSCLEIGAADFMKKPFNRDILISRINNTIANSKTIETLTEEASIDMLTGFLNKSSGTKRVEEYCKEQSGSLCIMDLDSFKLVNDLFGHDKGDEVLKAFADVLRANVREGSIVSRVGGDEFMAFYPQVLDKKEIEDFSNRLNNDYVKETTRLLGDDNGIPLGVSLGLVMIPEHGRDFECLFALADSALYMVKNNGKHGYYIYDKTCHDNKVLDDSLAGELEKITVIVEERTENKEAMLLGREAFTSAYHLLVRYHKAFKGYYSNVIFWVSMDNESDERKLVEVTDSFVDMLRRVLDPCDLIMQYKPDRYFVVLNKRTEEETNSFLDKIMGMWNKNDYAQKAKIEYYAKHISY